MDSILKMTVSESVSYFQFPGLLRFPWLQHGISTRTQNRNMSFSVDSIHGDPLQSRESFLDQLGLKFQNLVVPGQVHSANLHLVTKKDAGRGARGPQSIIPSTDGLLTEERGIPLLVTAADCPPVFLVDPEHLAIAVIHSGWKGTCAKIPTLAVQKMQEYFLSEPRQLHAAMGPGIGPCCYQVGESLIAELSEEERQFLLGRHGSWVLDLPKWIRHQLEKAGIPSSAIESAGLCTSCRKDLFYSHRAEKGNTGRVAAVIALR